MARTQSINLRLPVKDLAAARRLAEGKGLPYQTYIKMLLHEALQEQGGPNDSGGDDGETRATGNAGMRGDAPAG